VAAGPLALSFSAIPLQLITVHLKTRGLSLPAGKAQNPVFLYWRRYMIGMKTRQSTPKIPNTGRPLLSVVLVLAATLLGSCSTGDKASTALLIEKQGAFAVGGAILSDAAGNTQHCDHGVVEYQIPPRARSTNLLMWHSASAHAWMQRWDGGEGFQSIFVRRGFPVYLWDGPRVGRANWGCVRSEEHTSELQSHHDLVCRLLLEKKNT